MYIALVEMPLEIISGRLNAPTVFLSGGLAAVFQTRIRSFGSAFSSFMGSGLFIGSIGLYMHRGHDKS